MVCSPCTVRHAHTSEAMGWGAQSWRRGAADGAGEGGGAQAPLTLTLLRHAPRGWRKRFCKLVLSCLVRLASSHALSLSHESHWVRRTKCAVNMEIEMVGPEPTVPTAKSGLTGACHLRAEWCCKLGKFEIWLRSARHEEVLFSNSHCFPAIAWVFGSVQ